MSAISTSTTLTALPRTMNEVRQRLLQSIPSHHGDYRVVEGPELEPPQCVLLGTSNEVAPVFVIETKKRFAVTEVPGEFDESWNEFTYPAAYLKAVPFQSNLTAEAARLQGLGNLGLSPRVFWRKIPGTLPRESPPLDLSHLPAYNVAITQNTSDEDLTAYVFGRNFDPLDSTTSWREESDDETSPFDLFKRYGINITHDGDLIVEPEVAEHEEALPDNDESSSAEFGDSGDDASEFVMFEQDQAVEYDESEPEAPIATSTPNLLPTPVSNKKRNYADTQLKSDSYYGATKCPRVGRKSTRSISNNKKKNAVANYKWSYPHYGVKYPRGGKTARRSPSTEREATPSESDDSDDSDFEDPSPSKKRKYSRKGRIPAKKTSKPKSKAKAEAKGKQPSEIQDPSVQPDDDLENGEDVQDVQEAQAVEADEVLESIEHDEDDEDFEYNEDVEDNEDDEDDGDQYMPSPQEHARKSVSSSKALPQYESATVNLDFEDEEDIQPAPKRRPSTSKSLQQYGPNDINLDFENEDEIQFTRKRAHSSGSESLSNYESAGATLDCGDEDDIQPARKRARKSVSQTEEISQRQSNDFDYNEFGNSRAISTQGDVFPSNTKVEASEVPSPLPRKKAQPKSKPKAKTSSSKSAQPGGWSQAEHDAAERILRARRVLEASDRSVEQLRDERLFRYVSAEMANMGFTRAHGSIKNYWNRHGRVKSGFEERYGKAAGAPLVTSAQKAKGQAKPRVKKQK